jgi:hypothetical protein
MGDVLLVVDFGSTVTRALLAWPDGQLAAVAFGAEEWLPSGVYVGADGVLITGAQGQQRASDDPARYVADPVRRLGRPSISIGSTTVSPTDLVAAVLRRVWSAACTIAAQAPGRVVVVVPAGWGPRRRTAMTAACAAAGVPAPALVAVPVAAMAVLNLPAPAGAALVVCDLGSTFAVTVVSATGGGWQVTATADANDGGGAAVDEAVLRFVCDRIAVEDPGLADRLASPVTADDCREQYRLLTQVRAAKQRVAAGPAMIPTPLPHLSVSIDRARLAELSAPVRERAVAAMRTAIEAADLEPGQLVAMVCLGGSTPLPGFADALAVAAGAPLLPVERPDIAAMVGAAASPPSSSRPVSPTRNGGWSAHALVSVAVALVLGPMLLFYAVTTVPDQLNDFGMSVYFNYGLYGLACGLAGSAAVGGILVAVTAIPTPAIARGLGIPAGLSADRLPTVLLAAAGLGALVIGWMYRLVTVTYLDPDPPGLTRWTVLPILPASIAAFAVAAASLTHSHGLSLDALRRLAYPVPAVAMAATGAVIFEQARHVAVSSHDQWMLYTAMRVGAALIAAGAVTALFAGLRPLVIAALALPLTVLGAVVASPDNIGALAAAYLTAAGAWWLTRGVHASATLLRRQSRHPQRHPAPQWPAPLQPANGPPPDTAMQAEAGVPGLGRGSAT